jgi:hypothetical protein|tara:strand:- start:1084 stop:1353 length:270 start_codon:yes stop_codon:yes gene_type:complete
MVKIKSSKPISEIKKGDKMKVNGKEYEVDAHTVMIEHSENKEMAIDLFDSNDDTDYQLRYFDDRAEDSLQFYELKDILYDSVELEKLEW